MFKKRHQWISLYFLLTGELMSAIQKKLDSCIVSVYPSLNPDHESLTLPENMLTQFGIVAKISKDGATISGSDIIYNYEEVGLLNFKILYWNWFNKI